MIGAVIGLALLAAAAEARWPNLLELSVRPYLYQLSQKYGRDVRLADIPDGELDAFAADGITALYMLGMWELGSYGLNFDRTNADLLSGYESTLPGYEMADVIGSMFAVVNYTTNAREIGTDDDLREFRARLNARGIKLFLDFVPNHSAVDADQVAKHPEFYIRAAPGTGGPYDAAAYLPSGIAYGKDKYGSVWKDTAQYNYWDEGAVAARIDDLLTIAQFADGFRCDMAMLVLNSQINEIWGDLLGAWGYSWPAEEFWARAIAAVKAQHPDAVFMAETYWNLNQQLLDVGFDYAYDKEGLYDALVGGDDDYIRSYIESSGYDYLSRGAHFVENHDEARAAGTFGSVARADGAALVTYLLPGLKFHFEGQWVGKKNKLDVHLRRSADEPDSDEAVDFYARLLEILKDDVWYLGDYSYETVSGSSSSWRLISIRFEYDDGDTTTKVLAVINYSDAEGSGYALLPNAESPDGSGTVTLYDKFNDETYERDEYELLTTGIFVIIDAWDAQVFYY